MCQNCYAEDVKTGFEKIENAANGNGVLPASAFKGFNISESFEKRGTTFKYEVKNLNSKAQARKVK